MDLDASIKVVSEQRLKSPTSVKWKMTEEERAAAESGDPRPMEDEESKDESADRDNEAEEQREERSRNESEASVDSADQSVKR